VSRKLKKHRRTPTPASPDEVRFAGLWPLLPAAAVLGLLIATICGLEYLRAQVLAGSEYNPPLKIKLEYPEGSEWVEQEGWLPRISASVKLSTDRKLMDSNLLPALADQLRDSGWISHVLQVTRDMDGTVRARCEYRRPIAMMLTNRGKYIPVDKDGVRLPEEYDKVESDSGWMRILGVQSEPPAVGHAYGEKTPDHDAVAAVRLAALLFGQDEIAARISGIDVTNFEGREDKYKTHIKLWTRDGRVVKWGSAIGREVYEPKVTDKLRNLALWLRTNSPQAYADLTVYRNGVLAPIGP